MGIDRKKKILFLQKRFLFPPDSGGKIRTLNVLRHLAKWHSVTYLCNLLPEEREHLPEMEDLGLEVISIPWHETPRSSWKFYVDLAANLASRYPFNVNKDFDPRLRTAAERLVAEREFDLVVCDFVQMARNCLGIDSVAKLLFEHNVEAQIFERHAASDGGLARRAYMWLQWKKMFRFEGRAGRDFDGVIAVSENDRRTFERDYGWRHVQVIDTAVDTVHFQPTNHDAVAHRCVFVGSMDWLPNVDGVRYFVREIWPLVRSKFPNASFQVVGRNPTASIKALAAVPGVEVTGSVPDIRPYLSQAQVVVIPLLVGGGTRLKAYEAMAMGRPIASTSLGVEGLDIAVGENVMIGDTPEEFATQIARLFADQNLREDISAAALKMVRGRYSAEIVAHQFNDICENAILQWRQSTN